MLNNGHNTSPEYAANWTKAFLAPLLANEYFMNDTLILLTYEESETYSLPNKIASILLGGAMPSSLKGTTDDTFYTHYSIFSPLENNWDLPNPGRYDVGANVFQLVADHTGYKNEPYDISLVNLSASYSGFLNSGSYAPIPAANLQLIGAGGQGVAETVFDQWKSMSGETTPYVANDPPVYAAQAARASPTQATTSQPTSSSSVLYLV